MLWWKFGVENTWIGVFLRLRQRKERRREFWEYVENAKRDMEDGMEQIKFDLERYQREASDPDFIAGEQAMNEERYEDARVFLERGYRNGNILAGVLVGEMYYAGTGYECDYAKAIPYFQEGIEKDCPLGMSWLANCYLNGLGVPEDVNKAQELYNLGRAALREMALAGSADARFTYGIDLLSGSFPAAEMPEGYDPNQEGFRMLKLAEEQGLVGAGAAIAAAYLNGCGCEPDPEKAVAILDKYADRKNKSVHYWLGVTCYFGMGREQDFAKAREHLLLAAERGDDFAMNLLGDMYADGEGVEQDKKQAAEWYERAVRQGNPYARMQLADLCYSGDGVPLDKEKAARYFRESADEGIGEAAYSFARICILDEECLDRENGLRYLEQAANQGHLPAQKLLAECFQGKYGFEENEEQAAYWTMMAEGQEDAEAAREWDRQTGRG